MNIIDWIKRRVASILKVEKLPQKPDGERMTYIFDEEHVRSYALHEARVWYTGDSNELLNFYTNKETYANADEPIYNRNRANYFWGISAIENAIKRVHSGIPRAIIDTLVNAIGSPTIECDDARLSEILDANDFTSLVNQQQMPMTMVEGWGAFKIDRNDALSNHPIVRYYMAEDVEFICDKGILIGIIFKDYYSRGKDRYCLLETRSKTHEGLRIDYELFMLKDDDTNEVEQVPLSALDETKALDGRDSLLFGGYRNLLAVPSRFFFDPLNPDYGRSIYAGKIDLFDDLDQILSQDSQTIRVSTPVEYYPADLLERGKDGRTIMPKVYNRQYIERASIPSADGGVDGHIQTTQPQLNTEQYSADAMHKLSMILTGILSPATLGIDLSKRDNAEAQREKEKVTIMTRNNVIAREIRIVKSLCQQLLDTQDWIDGGTDIIPVDAKRNVSVTFSEFANPSFETELGILGPAWQNGQISTERYVSILWGGRLSDEKIAEEIKWLDDTRSADDLSLNDFNYETRERANILEQTGNEKDIAGIE